MEKIVSNFTLPSYLEMNDDVRNRFNRIKERPKILQVKNLSKNFKSQNGNEISALEKVDFDIHRREFISVIGPSGCGKSTLIRILAGLETPSSGEVLLDGQMIDGPGADRGMVFQGYTLFPWLTVKKNIMFGPKIKGLNDNTSEKEAKQWIEMVGLDRFADHYPHQLSGGMKQRVAIARALANHPRILLMDEPFGALDAQTRAQMQKHLLTIWKNIDISIFFITHDLDEAIYLSDRIIVLGANPGHVQEIIENPVPRHRSQEQFVSPEFLAVKSRLQALIHPVSSSDGDYDLHITKMTVIGDEVI